MKVFVTVGTQLPFDRLVQAVDAWVERNGDVSVHAQVGPTGYRPRHMRWSAFLEAPQCRQEVEDCDVVVAHAGMGTILTALEVGRPVVVMPRRKDLGEHRNDHQLATVRHLEGRQLMHVAYTEQDLLAKLEVLRSLDRPTPITACASSDLIQTLRDFIQTGTYRSTQPAAGRAVKAAAKPTDIDADEPVSPLATG